MDRQLRAHRYMIYVSAAAAVAAALAVSTPAAAQANNTPVERGRYLVRITGCHDCHSPKVQGMTPNLDLALSELTRCLIRGRPGVDLMVYGAILVAVVTFLPRGLAGAGWGGRRSG